MVVVESWVAGEGVCVAVAVMLVEEFVVSSVVLSVVLVVAMVTVVRALQAVSAGLSPLCPKDSFNYYFRWETKRRRRHIDPQITICHITICQITICQIAICYQKAQSPPPKGETRSSATGAGLVAWLQL